MSEQIKDKPIFYFNHLELCNKTLFIFTILYTNEESLTSGGYFAAAQIVPNNNTSQMCADFRRGRLSLGHHCCLFE